MEEVGEGERPSVLEDLKNGRRRYPRTKSPERGWSANEERGRTEGAYLPEDKERIRSKMEEAGILNMSAYVRKMALDGICVRLDLVDVRQLIVPAPAVAAPT